MYMLWLWVPTILPPLYPGRRFAVKIFPHLLEKYQLIWQENIWWSPFRKYYQKEQNHHRSISSQNYDRWMFRQSKKNTCVGQKDNSETKNVQFKIIKIGKIVQIKNLSISLYHYPLKLIGRKMFFLQNVYLFVRAKFINGLD